MLITPHRHEHIIDIDERHGCTTIGMYHIIEVEEAYHLREIGGGSPKGRISRISIEYHTSKSGSHQLSHHPSAILHPPSSFFPPCCQSSLKPHLSLSVPVPVPMPFPFPFLFRFPYSAKISLSNHPGFPINYIKQAMTPTVTQKKAKYGERSSIITRERKRETETIQDIHIAYELGK